MKHTDIKLKMLNHYYREFIGFYDESTEAPKEFILTCLISSIASAIGNKRWIKWGNTNIYPNVWSIIIGQSSLVRKSTALNIGTKFISYKQNETEEGLYLLPDISSQNIFIEQLNKNKQGILKVGEIRSFLSNMNKTYNEGMKSKFTEMFDVPDAITLLHRNLNEGKPVIVKEPIFSIASASTPQWLSSSLEKDDSTSGFIPRFICCYGETNKSIPIPKKLNAEDEKKMLSKLLGLYEIDDIELTLSQKAEDRYKNFYDKFQEIIKKNRNQCINPFLVRLRDNYCLKFAIIEATLEDVKVISDEMMERAIYLAEFYIEQIQSIYSIFTNDTKKKHEDNVITLLQVKGELSKSTIREELKFNTEILNKTLDSLEEAEVILSRKQRVDKAKKYTTFYSVNQEKEEK